MVDKSEPSFTETIHQPDPDTVGYQACWFEYISESFETGSSVVDNVQGFVGKLLTKNIVASPSEVNWMLVQSLIREEHIWQDVDPKCISLMLSLLEINTNKHKNVWSTIAEILSGYYGQESGENWKNRFQLWRDSVVTKQQFMDNWRHPSSGDITLSLSTMEKRAIALGDCDSDHLIESDIVPIDRDELQFDQMCRVCLRVCKEKINLFQLESRNEATDTISLADQINHLTDVDKINIGDGFPQHICRTCHEMLDIAAKFKLMCERSDKEMRSLQQEWMVKHETTEYVIASDEDEENVNYLDVCDEDEMETTETVRCFQEIKDDDSVNTFHAERTDLLNNLIDESSSQDAVSIISPDEHQIEYDEGGQCPTCGIRCSTAEILQRHTQSHLQPKPFRCDDCTKQFRTRIALAIHVRSHTDERPFVCETCGRAFKTHSALIAHLVIHTGLREFPCRICPYRGGSLANLRIHQRSHSKVQPYACLLCPLKFSTSSNLTKHVRNIHERVKAHGCDQCDRTFFSRDSARKHMVTHSGLKPYDCPACKMTYSWYNGLQKHMRSVHGGVRVPTEKHFNDQFFKKHGQIPAEI